MRIARSVVRDKQEKGMLEQISRGCSLPARLVGRAPIDPQKLYFMESCRTRMVPAAVTIPKVVGLRTLVLGVV